MSAHPSLESLSARLADDELAVLLLVATQASAGHYLLAVHLLRHLRRRGHRRARRTPLSTAPRDTP